jgi:5-histidylcysteine sulfoxide synthase/putative 4-mercaptohistidine N1-methyltranferase
MHPLHSRSVLLSGNNPEEKRQELLAYYRRTTDIYEQLFELLNSDESFYQRPEPLRHPLIFYFGHTATFFVNKLILAKAIPARVNPHFESMFAIGVDEMSWDDLNESNYNWPAVDEVRAYRREVRSVIERLILEIPLNLPVGWDDPVPWAIWMGIEHERIHLETSSVLIRQLDLQWLRSDPRWPRCPDQGSAPANSLNPVPGGMVTLGKSRDDRLYGWDNEYGETQFGVSPFSASTYLVSNGEYLPFIEAGGYSEQRWWCDEGWRWLGFSQRRQPVFWFGESGNYRLRTLSEEIDMPWNWPVEVNQLEARAFCRWKAEVSGEPIRLPTEAEWYRLRDWLELPDEPEWPQPVGWNINLEHYASSVPVDRFGQDGFFDVIGNVWQWTETPIDGFDGFAVHPLYDDFSTPTFDNQHNLIKGGSWISTGNEAIRASRYAFRRHFYQHAGLRYVSGTALPPPPEKRQTGYESDEAVAQYCHFHYGEAALSVANFPREIARMAIDAHQGRFERALDLGCATGRATFELASRFQEVTGIDFSARFIRQAVSMQENGLVRYQLPTEGELHEEREVTLASLGLGGLEQRVTFWQGDAHNLKPQFSDFDLVIAANLVDRLYHPARMLQQIGERIRCGGTLLIATPCTWLEEYTPRESWLGGYRDQSGKAVTTLATLQRLLEPDFIPVGEPRQVEFVIRETARKHQHTLSEVTIWQRR